MINRSVRASQVRDHFDQMADFYDAIKSKNRYYYQSLKNTVQDIIGPGKKVLDIGTSTGEVLNFLSPSKGVGIDISSKSIEIAKKKFPHLEFHTADHENFKTKETFDYILLADVIEHLEAPETLFYHLKKLASHETKIVLTMANPIWEPVLEVLERLKLKMAEGPHLRVSDKSIINSAKKYGFSLKSKDYYLLVPFYIPKLSRHLNNIFAKTPVLRKLSIIQRLVFKQ